MLNTKERKQWATEANVWEDEKKKFMKRETRLRNQMIEMNFLLNRRKTNCERNVTVKTNFDGYDHANLSQIGSFLRLKFPSQQI